MRTLPLVSVICLSYNHEKFIEEALTSLFHQTYPAIEIIIADDASTDNSYSVIEQVVAGRAGVKVFRNETNLGNCKTFNKAFQQSSGKYIIDFALDDVLSPERIQTQVELLEQLDESYGVVHSDAAIIDDKGTYIRKWSDRNLHVENGWVFEAVLRQSFICAPTMMIRREVLEYLGGYDETLAYEDFDFWIRSSVKYKYFYSSEILTKKRVLVNSLSGRGERKGYGIIQESTARVCEKAHWLSRNTEEKAALKKRILLEMRHALLVEAYEAVKVYYRILTEMNETGLKANFISILAAVKFPAFLVYRLYKKVR
jgi:glycosyltransferase involved in cell wall biosynthesis